MFTSTRMLFFVALALHTAAGLADGASPIEKVLQLMTGLQRQIIREGEEAQRVYDEAAEWCEDRSRDLHNDIKTAKGEMEDQKATIEQQESKIGTFNTRIGELSGSIAEDEQDLKQATGVRSKEQADFAAEEEELMAIVNTLERAISILEEEMKKGGGASMLQTSTKSVESLSQALSAMVQASAMSAADASRLAALAQSSMTGESEDGDEDDATDAPEAAAHESKSGGIVDTMNDLLDKAQTQLDEARQKESEALNEYKLLKQSFEDKIKVGKGEMDKAKKGLAESGEKKSGAEGELTVTSKELQEDEKALSELHHDCMEKAQEFESVTKSRGEELAVVKKAKEIIAEATGGASLEQASFVQLAQRSSADSREGAAIVRYLRDLAARHHSMALSQLSARAEAAVRLGGRGGGDPFAKVRGLIADMISKLEAEAEKAAGAKAFCDKELGETNEKHADKQADVDKYNTRIDQMTSKSAKLKEEAGFLQKAISKVMQSQAMMDKIRQEENAEFKKAAGETEKALEGVKLALKVLKEYYGKGDAAHDSGDGAAAGIIGLLEVCESEFSKTLAELKGEEEAALAAYEAETNENKVEQASKEKSVKHIVKESAELDKAVAEEQSDRAGVEEELDAVVEYLEKIKAQCVAQPDSYAERKKRRDAELAGLKQAVEMLDGGAAAFLQRASRRFLRGARA